MNLKYKAGEVLKASVKNPEVRRWTKVGAASNFGDYKAKTPNPEDLTHLGHINTTDVAVKFVKSAKGFQTWRDGMSKGSKLREVAEKFDETKYRLAKEKEKKWLFGLIRVWPGPHYNNQTREIVFDASDLSENTSVGKVMRKIDHGDFSTILKHEAAHAWDFSRGEVEAKAEGKTNGSKAYSHWIARKHPEIKKKVPKPPDWMRNLDGPMSRFCYAAMVPHEMPSVMTEMAHIDPARYHAAHELFKENHDVNLDAMMTDFWGKKITPPRPTDGSVEKYKAQANIPLTKKEKRNPYLIDPDWGDTFMPYQEWIGYSAQESEPEDDGIPFPDHRISWLPLKLVMTLMAASRKALSGTPDVASLS